MEADITCANQHIYDKKYDMHSAKCIPSQIETCFALRKMGRRNNVGSSQKLARVLLFEGGRIHIGKHRGRGSIVRWERKK